MWSGTAASLEPQSIAEARSGSKTKGNRLPVLRRAEPGDMKTLASLFASAFEAGLRQDLSSDLLAQVLPKLSILDRRLIADGTYFVACLANGCMVGAGGWSRAQPGRGEIRSGRAHLRHFAVAPEASHQGIGRAIFSRCVRDAGLATTFECCSTRPAVAFYRALGFEVLGLVSVPMGPGLSFPSVRMIRHPQPENRSA